MRKIIVSFAACAYLVSLVVLPVFHAWDAEASRSKGCQAFQGEKQDGAALVASCSASKPCPTPRHHHHPKPPHDSQHCPTCSHLNAADATFEPLSPAVEELRAQALIDSTGPPHSTGALSAHSPRAPPRGLLA